MTVSDKALAQAFRELHEATRKHYPHSAKRQAADGIEKRARELDAEKGGDGPAPELLVSMALCLDHGFGLRDAAWQESKLRDMRKLWDEVMGRGFYSPERKAFYRSMTTPPAQAAEAVSELVTKWRERAAFCEWHAQEAESVGATDSATTGFANAKQLTKCADELAATLARTKGDSP